MPFFIDSIHGDAKLLETYQRDRNRIMALSAIASICAFLYYFQNGQFLLYGDAVAHIAIARRTFDSLTPGLLQLGTVWLPLPHLLISPFLTSDAAWQSGVGGSIPSMFAYVLAVDGVFCLASMRLPRGAAWLATAIFALNPNLLYLQSAAMTEALYLAAFIWALVFFLQFRARVFENEGSLTVPLVKCAITLSAAMLTRYDGWFLSGVIGLAVWVTAFAAARRKTRGLFKPVAIFTLLCVLAPAAWLFYNYKVYRNALEFANGPYSARAISMKMSGSGAIMHPGWHDWREARAWYNKSARMNLGAGPWEHVLFWPALLAGLVSLCNVHLRPLALLWVPSVFYTLSIAYGGVPIFVPDWYSGAYVNIRYGTQLIPAVAVGFAMMVQFIADRAPIRIAREGIWTLALALASCGYASVWLAIPICVQEGFANGHSKTMLEQSLAEKLRSLPKDAMVLMYLGEHPGAVMRAGIPLKQVINENNWPYWQDALKDPAHSAEFIVAFEGDPVSEAVAVHPDGLEKLVQMQVAGQKRATLYHTKLH